jgi:hypothetical protein
VSGIRCATKKNFCDLIELSLLPLVLLFLLLVLLLLLFVLNLAQAASSPLTLALASLNIRMLSYTVLWIPIRMVSNHFPSLDPHPHQIKMRIQIRIK